MFRRAAALAILFTVTSSLPLLASDRDDNAAAPATTVTASAPSAAEPAGAGLPSWAIDRAAKRPPALLAMYGTYGTLQVMDLVSTRKAIAAGAHEANPLMGSGGSTRMLAVKAATGAMSIYLAEKMWKKNRVGAIVTMAAINGMTAAAVARNAHNARR